MKQQLKKLPHFLFYLLSFIAIQACSGGSSTGGDTTPSDPGNPDNGYSLNVDQSSISVRSEVFTPSTESFDINITFEGDGLLIGFAPGAGPVEWAEYQLNDVTATSAKLTINIVNTETIDLLGTFATTLRLTTGNVGTQEYAYQDVVMSLETWQLATATAALSFSETYGAAALPTQSFDVISSGVAWTATSNAEWLTLDMTSGTDNQTITVAVDPSHSSISAAGAFSGMISLTETMSGETQEIPVDLALDSVRLISNYPALSLYKLADQELLSELVDITNNSDNEVTWQATSSDSWIDVVIDAVNNTLTISKNSTTLADGQHDGEVSLSSISNGVAQTTTINVGYYQSTNASDTVELNGFVPTTVESIAFDPTRPLIYLAGDTNITTHHLFTGDLVDTIVTPISLSNLVISPSGEYLLGSAIVAATNPDDSDELHIYRLDLNTQVITQIALPAENAITFMPHFIANVNGEEIIITEAQEYATLDLTRHYWQRDDEFFVSTVQQAANTNTVTFLRTQTPNGLPSESTFYTFEMSYNEFASNKISVGTPLEFTSTTYQGAAPLYFDISNTGDTIHTAQNDSESLTFDGNDYVENGVLYDTALTTSIDVKLDTQNNSYYYRARLNNDPLIPAIYSLSKYDSDLNLSWSQDIDNASGSSFILTNFERFLTFNEDTNVWFATSFPN